MRRELVYDLLCDVPDILFQLRDSKARVVRSQHHVKFQFSASSPAAGGVSAFNLAG